MGQTALVIGSGMGGLTAAQALSSHFSSSVVLLEKDQPDTLTFSTSLEAAQMGAKARPGVMQVRIHCRSTLLPVCGVCAAKC